MIILATTLLKTDIDNLWEEAGSLLLFGPIPNAVNSEPIPPYH
jgi:hypothetical protein